MSERFLTPLFSAGSTVTLWRTDEPGVTATTTADSSGDWTVTFTLLEGGWAFTGTATLNDETSDLAHDFLVTVDRTAPTLAIEAPATSYDPNPLLRVRADD